MLNRRYIVAIAFISPLLCAFDKKDLEKYAVENKASWMLLQLQNFGWPLRGNWFSKSSALASGLTTEIQWNNIGNFEALIKVDRIKEIQTFFNKCTDDFADAMYQFVAHANNNDDLVKKQNTRDERTLENGEKTLVLGKDLALQRIVETAIFDCAVKPTRKA